MFFSVNLFDIELINELLSVYLKAFSLKPIPKFIQHKTLHTMFISLVHINCEKTMLIYRRACCLTAE